MWRAILFIFAGPLTVDQGFGQWPSASPKAIEVINTWSDSLYQWQEPPPRFLNFHGKPLCVSITECNMDGADPQKFDAKQPFKDLPCEAGIITTFRFDTLGRVLSRSMRGESRGEGGLQAPQPLPGPEVLLWRWLRAPQPPVIDLNGT